MDRDMVPWRPEFNTLYSWMCLYCQMNGMTVNTDTGITSDYYFEDSKHT